MLDFSWWVSQRFYLFVENFLGFGWIDRFRSDVLCIIFCVILAVGQQEYWWNCDWKIGLLGLLMLEILHISRCLFMANAF